MARSSMVPRSLLLTLLLLQGMHTALALFGWNQPSLLAEDPRFCFVVRTYYGHGGQFDNTLRRILKNLQDQEGEGTSSWVALMLVLDSRPFQDLRKIIREFKDPRMSVYAEMIAAQYQPKNGDQWTVGYHTKLYSETDEAIRACPRSTEWVIVTNGDNEYDTKFLSELLSVPDDVDVVAFDFYSRYQRPTANPCDRIASTPGFSNCKRNDMSFCQTDLAANAFRWRRMLAENKRFGQLDKEGFSSSNDGMMASMLTREGWKIHHVADGKCLVSHDPNPQGCAMQGGMVWDDSVMFEPQSFGGLCMSHSHAAKKVALDRDTYEIVAVNISYDPNSFGYGAAIPEGSVFTLQCLRKRDRRLWQQAYVFGRVCTDRGDWDSLPLNLPAHPWDTYLDKKQEHAGNAEQTASDSEAEL